MPEATKAVAKIAGVELAANSALQWQLRTGTAPYVGEFACHADDWQHKLRQKTGDFVDLSITDARGVTSTFRNVTILHRVASDSPNRVRFLVADRRWRWSYKLITRDYNHARKSGDRTALNSVPIENQITVDQYEYRTYSLRNGNERWKARDAVEDVLGLLEDESDFEIDSFPIAGDAEGEAGQFSLQNVTLRDQGDVALARLLAMIPGAEVMVGADGRVRVFDGADLEGAEQHFAGLPPRTWDGDASAMIERSAIRPAKVFVHYQREVELLMQFSDDWAGNTIATPSRDEPFLENVIPTVDPETQLDEYDPVLGEVVTKFVPAGTWVEVRRWLAAMDQPEGSFPWTFQTIREAWLAGDLEARLGARADAGGLAGTEQANVAARIAAFRAHFRQTFRLNRRYTERIRDVKAVRAGVLDPVTGTRTPAAVWGQYATKHTPKGLAAAHRYDPEKARLWLNVDDVPDDIDDVKSARVSPALVEILDEDLCIFRVEWQLSPYGTNELIVPCHTVDDTEQPAAVVADLGQQDDVPVGTGFRRAEGGPGLFLSKRMELLMMVTIVPAAPNNARQFHRVEVKAHDVEQVFQREFRIQEGRGPDLHVFVPPGEVTARFAWDEGQQANDTVAVLLGLNSDDPNESGIEEGHDLPGFQLANGQRQIKGHSGAVAVEMLAPFADNRQGRVATIASPDGLTLVGNKSSATLVVTGAPSAKVMVVHEFPGQQKPISRFATLPAAARTAILGILPFGKPAT